MELFIALVEDEGATLQMPEVDKCQWAWGRISDDADTPAGMWKSAMKSVLTDRWDEMKADMTHAFGGSEHTYGTALFRVYIHPFLTCQLLFPRSCLSFIQIFVPVFKANVES